VPEDLYRDARPRDALLAAATASYVGQVQQRNPEDLVRDNEPARLLLRAASNLATVGTSSWAGALAGSAVEDLFTSMTSISAGAGLAARCLRVTFPGGVGSVVIPGRVVLAADSGSFVAEGAPIPVRTLPLASVTLSPFKLAVIATLSEEVAAYSNAEAIINKILGEAAALRFDSELLSNTAASSSRPAGLTAGLTPLTGATAGSEAMSTDIGALVGALATAGGGQDIVFIASPKQAAALKLRAGAQFTWPVLSSPALAAGSVMAVEAGGVVFGFSSIPEFDVSRHSALHMEDSSPLPIAAGTGPTVASPVRSLWQTATVAVRLSLRVAWSVRAAGLVQILTGANW
jgi:hypothetical protein